MPSVRFFGWRIGFNTVAMNHMLRKEFGLGLAEAKRLVDLLIDGGEFALAAHGDREAEKIAEQARLLGALAEVVPEL